MRSICSRSARAYGLGSSIATIVCISCCACASRSLGIVDVAHVVAQDLARHVAQMAAGVGVVADVRDARRAPSRCRQHCEQRPARARGYPRVDAVADDVVEARRGPRAAPRSCAARSCDVGQPGRRGELAATLDRRARGVDPDEARPRQRLRHRQHVGPVAAAELEHAATLRRRRVQAEQPADDLQPGRDASRYRRSPGRRRGRRGSRSGFASLGSRLSAPSDQVDDCLLPLMNVASPLMPSSCDRLGGDAAATATAPPVLVAGDQDVVELDLEVVLLGPAGLAREEDVGFLVSACPLMAAFCNSGEDLSRGLVIVNEEKLVLPAPPPPPPAWAPPLPAPNENELISMTPLCLPSLDSP